MVASDSLPFLLGARSARPAHNAAYVGKAGVFCDGLMFGMVTDNMLYLRVDEHNRAAFKEAESFRPQLREEGAAP